MPVFLIDRNDTRRRLLGLMHRPSESAIRSLMFSLPAKVIAVAQVPAGPMTRTLDVAGTAMPLDDPAECARHADDAAHRARRPGAEDDGSDWLAGARDQCLSRSPPGLADDEARAVFRRERSGRRRHDPAARRRAPDRTHRQAARPDRSGPHRGRGVCSWSAAPRASAAAGSRTF